MSVLICYLYYTVSISSIYLIFNNAIIVIDPKIIL